MEQMDQVKVPPVELTEFVRRTAKSFGAADRQASVLADVLVWSDLVGRSSYGVSRLPILCERLGQNAINGGSNPQFSQKAPAMGILDGDGGSGHYVGDIAMRRAVELARGNGVGCVGTFNSNFFGAAAYYVHLATTSEMIGIAMSNSFPKVVAHGGVEAVLGTNPLAFGTPRRNGRDLLLDMATSAFTGSAVRRFLDDNRPLPDAVAVDQTGRMTHDPNLVAQGDAALLPLAGAKGYGLALMVEILSAVVTGAGMSSGVRSMYRDLERSGQNGHFFLALDIASLMPINDYYDRFESLERTVLSSGARGDVRFPGDARWEAYDENGAKGAPIDGRTREALEVIGARSGVPVPW